jgi:hypothetical protein
VTRNQSQVSYCGICGGQSGTVACSVRQMPHSSHLSSGAGTVDNFRPKYQGTRSQEYMKQKVRENLCLRFFNLSNTPRKRVGEMEVLLHAFSVSAQSGGEWSASRPRGEYPLYPLGRRLGGSWVRSRHGGEEKVSALQGIELRSFARTASSLVTILAEPSRLFTHASNATDKGKAIPVTGREDPWGCETSRLSHFLDNRLTDGGELSAPHASCPLPPGRFRVLISVRG